VAWLQTWVERAAEAVADRIERPRDGRQVHNQEGTLCGVATATLVN